MRLQRHRSHHACTHHLLVEIYPKYMGEISPKYMEEVEGMGSPTQQVALGNQPPQAGKITETLEMLVVRESTSSQRMHISVGKARAGRVTTARRPANERANAGGGGGEAYSRAGG